MIGMNFDMVRAEGELMKRERALVERRRSQILEVLTEKGEIKVDELAKEWRLSPLTIRRDLQVLEDEHKVERFYGGATLIANQDIDEDEGTYYRRKIAMYAASLVEDGDSIFINTSMTALDMIKYLGDKRVTVITNNGRVMNIDVPPSVSILLAGGELRYPKYAMVGEFALRNLETITAKKSFLGCSGLSPERGMTTEIMNEVPINRLMFNHVSGHAFILATSKKIGVNSSFVSQEIENISHLITDEKAPQDVIEQLRSHNVSIYQVKKD